MKHKPSYKELVTLLIQACSYIDDIQLDFDLTDNGIKEELEKAIAKTEDK